MGLLETIVGSRVLNVIGLNTKQSRIVADPTARGPFTRDEIMEKVPQNLITDFEQFIDNGDISSALSKAMDSSSAIQGAVEMAFATKAHEFEDFARALHEGDAAVDHSFGAATEPATATP